MNINESVLNQMIKNVFVKLQQAKVNILTRQFLFFAGVGVIGTTGHYIILIVLVQIGNIIPVYASTLGFTAGALINYLLNYKYTFQSQKNHTEAMVKFFIVALVGASINGVLMFIGTELLKFNYIIVQIFGTTTVVFITFYLNMLWTFSKPDN